MSVIGFFFFHLMCSPLAIMGHPASWFHDNDLITNFTMAVLGLAQNWFAKKWPFMKEVHTPIVEDTPKLPEELKIEESQGKKVKGKEPDATIVEIIEVL